MGKSENNYIAWLARRVQNKEQALPPILVVHDRIWKGLWNLMGKVFVQRREASHF